MQSGAWSDADASTATPRLYEQVLARIRATSGMQTDFELLDQLSHTASTAMAPEPIA